MRLNPKRSWPSGLWRTALTVAALVAISIPIAVGDRITTTPRSAAIGAGHTSSVDPALFRSASPSTLTDAASPAVIPTGGDRVTSAASKRRHAVIVGINNAPGTPRLYGAVNDATTLRDALLRYGYEADEITLLTERGATRSAVLHAIGELADLPADGQAIFAFAGHARWSKGRLRVTSADGEAIWESDLARALAGIQAPTWVNLATCYAAGFDAPGITGPGRIATFAAPANRYAWESKSFGRSFLVQYMVHDGMLEGLAPDASVEDTFAYANTRLRDEYPGHTGLVDDGIPGEFRLGPQAAHIRQPEPEKNPSRQAASEPEPDRRHTDGPAPPAPPPRRDDDDRDKGSGGVVCGTVVSVGNCDD